MNQNIFEIIGTVITGIVGPIIIIIFQRFFKKKKEIDPLTEAASFSSRYENHLEDLLTEYEADRLWVAQFHNGGHFSVNNKSIQKFSIFYEVLSDKPEVPSKKMTYQNIPISLFSKSINHIFENDYLALPDFDESRMDFGLKYIEDKYQTKSSYMFALTNVKGKHIGMLVLEYTDPKKLSDAEIEELIIKSSQVGAILYDEYLKVKK